MLYLYQTWVSEQSSKHSLRHYSAVKNRENVYVAGVQPQDVGDFGEDEQNGKMEEGFGLLSGQMCLLAPEQG